MERLLGYASNLSLKRRDVIDGRFCIAGQFLPAGTIVGINSWVMHADKQVYGEDAEKFRPERWFDTEERVREMKRYNMAVGVVRSDRKLGFALGTNMWLSNSSALARVSALAGIFQ